VAAVKLGVRQSGGGHGYHEQFSELCRHQIPNMKKVKNPRTYSIFESLMNFKWDLNLLKKSDKFSKIPS
jgi:hypothetical protein